MGRTTLVAIRTTLLCVLCVVLGGGSKELAVAAEKSEETVVTAGSRTGPPRAAEIVIGNIADLTGPTSAVGKPYAAGIAAYAEYFNGRGGVGGKRLKLVTADCGFKTEKAVAAYRNLRDVERVVAVQGWGAGESQALSKEVGADKILYFSASYSALLSDPARAPYHFFVTADYTTQLQAGLKYVGDIWRGSESPKIAFLYPDHPYGRTPIAKGIAFAEERGFEVASEQIVGLNAIEAVVQLMALKRHEPDFLWFGGTTPSCAVTLKDAKKLGLKTRFLVNIWGNDETLIGRSGEAAEGVLGLQAASVYGDDVRGMRTIRQVTDNRPQTTHFIRGWVSMMVLCEILRRADATGAITGPRLKQAAETLENFDTLGLTAPITYTDRDHQPNRSAKIYEFRGGKMVYRDTVMLGER